MIAAPLREDFFEAQARHRSKSVWLRVLAVIAAAALGIPLSVALTPIIVAAIVIGVDAVNAVSAHVGLPLPDVGAYIGVWLDAFARDIDATTDGWSMIRMFASHSIALVLPGVAAMACVYVVFARGGAAALESAIEDSLAGRAARADDIEETQIGNIAHEMAIAAHLPPPRVLIVDTAEANAAMVGTHPSNARLYVTRGLLDTMSRDETQAVVGHLLGSIGNGDTLIIRAWLRFATALLLVGGLISGGMYDGLPPSERPFRRTLRYMFGRGDPGARADLLAQIQTNLDNVSSGSNDDTVWQKAWAVLRLPLLICFGAFTMNRMIFLSLLVHPLTARLWRARRLLADAISVQLTRQATPLATALTHVTGWEAARNLAFLCVSWSRDVPGAPPSTRPLVKLNELLFGTSSSLPPFNQRRDRLASLGAQMERGANGSTAARDIFGPMVSWPMKILLVIVFGFCAVAALGCALALVGIALAIYGLFLMPVVMGLHFLLR